MTASATRCRRKKKRKIIVVRKITKTRVLVLNRRRLGSRRLGVLREHGSEEGGDIEHVVDTGEDGKSAAVVEEPVNDRGDGVGEGDVKYEEDDRSSSNGIADDAMSGT
jgi:hypothetical protein